MPSLTYLCHRGSIIPLSIILSLPLYLYQQTFVPDEDSGGDKRGREESSWLQTVELTHTHHRTPLGGGGGAGGVGVVRGLGVRGEVLQNPLYEDEDYEEGEGEREGEVEMSAMEFDWALPPPSPTHSSDL